MADEAPPDDTGGHVDKPNCFDAALSHFASSFVKNELQQLTRKSDDTLARCHVPKLRRLLREVDRERQAFEENKERLIRDLRQKLELLQVDSDTIDAAVAELNPVAPKYLGIIPSASTLTIRPPTPVVSPVRDNYFSTVLAADHSSNTPLPALRDPDRGRSRSTNDLCSGSTNINVSPTIGPRIDDQAQNQVLSESSSVASQAQKRSGTETRDSDDRGLKRRKADGAKGTPPRAKSDIFRKIAFPNLETGERIFRHSERPGLYFVIRCNRPNCTVGFFTEPPLVYNRALKHFQNHGEKGPDGEELTNEYIFENFACQIEGASLVSKYWMKEHLGPSPHTFSPGKSRSRTAQSDGINARKRPDAEDKTYMPSSRRQPRDVPNTSDDDESETEKPRRTPRSVARPDYAELVAGKDPWNSDHDGDKVDPRTPKGSRAHNTNSNTSKPREPSASRSRSTSQASTLGPSPTRSKATEPSKPFGYTSEQWPRRAAPS